MTRSEEGSATVMAIAVVTFTLTTAAAMAVAGSVLHARALAVNAADAAALAAAPATFTPLELGDPRVRAAETAFANGGRLTDCSCEIDATWSPRIATVMVQVVVEVPVIGPTTVEAVSSAEFRPVVLTDR